MRGFVSGEARYEMIRKNQHDFINVHFEIWVVLFTRYGKKSILVNLYSIECRKMCIHETIRPTAIWLLEWPSISKIINLPLHSKILISPLLMLQCYNFVVKASNFRDKIQIFEKKMKVTFSYLKPKIYIDFFSTYFCTIRMF